MIWRAGATAGGIGAVAVANLSDVGATVQTSQPVIAFFFGYPFEVAGMIAALFGCLMARFWIGAGQWARKQYRAQLDLPVSGAVLAVAAALVIATHPGPFLALIYGMGAGVMGEAIFKIAENTLLKGLSGLGVGGDSPAPPPPPPAA